MIFPLLVHAGVWSAAGAAGGLAFGLGLGKRAMWPRALLVISNLRLHENGHQELHLTARMFPSCFIHHRRILLGCRQIFFSAWVYSMRY